MVETADGRVYKRKRIKDPNDENNYIDIPVIYSINAKCQQEQAQEFLLTFNNSSTSSRSTHIKRVTNNQDASQYLDVERIDEWTTKTMQAQAQEHTFVLRNTDPPPIQPAGADNPSHQQKHVVRYYKSGTGEPQCWVDCELIDELTIVDASSQYQEWRWYFRHPEIGFTVSDSSVPYVVTAGYCDPSLELAAVENGLDPPYRLDPLQNIVNCKWTAEEQPTSGYPIVWIAAWWEGGPHAVTRTAWFQLHPEDPPYPFPYPLDEIDYGMLGGVPWEDVDFGGFALIVGDSWLHYQPQVDAYALDAKSQSPPGGTIRAIVSFVLGEDWTI